MENKSVYDVRTLIDFAVYLDDTAEKRGWILNNQITNEGMEVLSEFNSQVNCRTVFSRL